MAVGGLDLNKQRPGYEPFGLKASLVFQFSCLIVRIRTLPVLNRTDPSLLRIENEPLPKMNKLAQKLHI
jgi:hypothetical protein